MQELNNQEVDMVSGGDIAGLGQAMGMGGGVLMGAGAAALTIASVAALGPGLICLGAAWGIGGALIWAKTSIAVR